MPRSAVPAFKAALVARLQADAGLADCQVIYGELAYPRQTEKDAIGVADVFETQASYEMGRLRRREKWIQEVTISVLRQVRNDAQETTERAYDILGEIEDSILAWQQGSNKFDGTVLVANVVGHDLRERMDSENREARITLRIDCEQIV